MKIVPAIGQNVSEIVEGISEKTVSVRVISKNDQRLNFTVESRDLVKNTVVLSLDFSSVNGISQSSVSILSFLKTFRNWMCLK